MAGTREGGAKAKATLKQLYGADYYTRLASIGGRKSKTGGFASEEVGEDGLTGRERAIIAGEKGRLTFLRKLAKA